MSLRSAVKNLVEKLTGTRIFRTLPQGVDLGWDIRRLLPRFECRTVLDVGANTGQSAVLFLQWFPGAVIHCFEPVAETYGTLTTNMAPHSSVRCHRTAMGAVRGRGRMLLEGTPDLYHLLGDGDDPTPDNPSRTEVVEIGTVSEFCEAQGIEMVDLLKIDTEGHDLDVLKGSAALLDRGLIRVVMVEAGMNPRNHRHVPLEDLRKHLEERKYFLFGLYDQANEWPTGRPNLRRANGVFVSVDLIEENRA